MPSGSPFLPGTSFCLCSYSSSAASPRWARFGRNWRDGPISYTSSTRRSWSACRWPFAPSRGAGARQVRARRNGCLLPVLLGRRSAAGDPGRPARRLAPAASGRLLLQKSAARPARLSAMDRTDAFAVCFRDGRFLPILPVAPTAGFWRSPRVPGQIGKGSKGSTLPVRRAAGEHALLARNCRSRRGNCGGRSRGKSVIRPTASMRIPHRKMERDLAGRWLESRRGRSSGRSGDRRRAGPTGPP